MIGLWIEAVSSVILFCIFLAACLSKIGHGYSVLSGIQLYCCPQNTQCQSGCSSYERLSTDQPPWEVVARCAGVASDMGAHRSATPSPSKALWWWMSPAWKGAVTCAVLACWETRKIQLSPMGPPQFCTG